MKILLATPIYPPDIGGPAIYVQRLARELSQRNIEVIVLTFSDEERIENTDFSVIRISRAYPKGIRHLLYLLELLRLAPKADVIYAQSPVNVGLPSLIVSKILKKKLILKVVGDAAWENYASPSQKFDGLEIFQKKDYGFFIELIRSVQKLVVKNVDAVIVPSQYLKEIVSGWGAPKKKINVIYNAVGEELSNVSLSKEKAKKKIGIEGNIILSVGRLSPWKGFEVLIEAMPDLLKENPNFKLIIVGEGNERKNLESRIKNLKLEKNVLLTGRIAHQDIGFYFKAADIFVLNSGYEGLPHVVLEAMQFEVPIIVSRKGGNIELIQNDFNGFLIEYNNKEDIRNTLLKLWQNKNLQAKFIQNSKEKLKDFTWEILLEKTLKILSAD